MTISNVTFSTSGEVTGTPTSFTHPVTGTPKGVTILTLSEIPSLALTVCTYGGVACAAMTGSPVNKTTGENGTVWANFLGNNTLSGDQTVSVTLSAAGEDKAVYCMTNDSDENMEENATATISSDALPNPSVNLPLGSVTSLVTEVFISGQNSVGSITPLSGWSDQGEIDMGNQVAASYSFDTIGSTDVSCGYTANNADVILIAVAIAEIVGNITASGNPSIPAIEAAGTAIDILPASGTPSIPAIVAAGTATVGVVITASGAAIIPPIEAAGTAVRRVQASDGAPAIPAIVAAGTAIAITTASGTPSVPAIVAAGNATVIRSASGNPSIPAIVAAGTATVGIVTAVPRIVAGVPGLVTPSAGIIRFPGVPL